MVTQRIEVLVPDRVPVGVPQRIEVVMPERIDVQRVSVAKGAVVTSTVGGSQFIRREAGDSRGILLAGIHQRRNNQGRVQ